jgi:hypothetical protein
LIWVLLSNNTSISTKHAPMNGSLGNKVDFFMPSRKFNTINFLS